MIPPKMGFGDTTYTKVFVGGLAWETKKETMKKYFEQFGEILEAVVITDKNTGRSRGYGFVTFREPEAATKACVDPSPVIDGRRANCNLASLGVQRSIPTAPQLGGGRSFRVMKAFHAELQGGVGAAFPSPTTFPHYAIQQGVPYNVYGYPSYSPEYTYPASYYNVYGGIAGQYPMYGTTAFNPCYQFGQGGGSYTNGQNYCVQYPQMFQYSVMASNTGVTGFTQHYGGFMSMAPGTLAQPGVTMAPTTPTLPTPSAHHYRLIPAHFPSSASEQLLA